MLATLVGAGALCLTLGGCQREEAPVSDSQVAQWNTNADREIPGLDVTVALTDVTTMTAQTVTGVAITVTFDDLALLTGSTDALMSLRDQVQAQANGLPVELRAEFADAVGVNQEALPALQDEVTGVADGWAQWTGSYAPSGSEWTSQARVVIYVEEPDVITPSWLDDAMSALNEEFAQYSAQVGSIEFRVREGDSASKDFTTLDLRAVAALADVVSSPTCLKTASWTFGVGDGELSPAPRSAPAQGCS